MPKRYDRVKTVYNYTDGGEIIKTITRVEKRRRRTKRIIVSESSLSSSDSLDVSSSSSSIMDLDRLVECSGCDEDFVKSVVDRTIKPDILTKKFRQDNLTSILRLAYHDPWFNEFIKDNMYRQGVPLKRWLYSTVEDDECGCGIYGCDECCGEWSEFSLMDYQSKAVLKMLHREVLGKTDGNNFKGGILSFQMGLGKTITSLVHALSKPRTIKRSRSGKLKDRYGDHGFPVLVVCPLSLLETSWVSDCINKFFTSDINYLCLHPGMMSKKDIKALTRKDIVKYDIVLTTYDMLISACRDKKWFERCMVYGQGNASNKVVEIKQSIRQDTNHPNVKGLSLLYTTPWDGIIFDESTAFVNPSTARFRCAMALYGEAVWCLTGTPVMGKETDIFSQIRVCGYNRTVLKNDWCKNWEKYMKQYHIRKYIIAETYESVGMKLPKLHLNVVTLQFKPNSKEKKIYDYVLGVARDAYDELMKGCLGFSSILALFIRLRQCCVAPFLMTDISKLRGSSGKWSLQKKAAGDIVLRDMMKKLNKGAVGVWVHTKIGPAGYKSTKILAAIVLIDNVVGVGGKFVVFSMFTSALHLLHDALEEASPDIKSLVLDGSVKVGERSTMLSQFLHGDVNVLFINLRIGGMGLNLVEATDVMFLEPWWTPAVEQQGIFRLHRIGQEKEVTVHRLYIEGSIEDRILQICNEKADLSQRVLSGLNVSIPRLDKNTIGRILG